jgi:hypothetical protein
LNGVERSGLECVFFKKVVVVRSTVAGERKHFGSQEKRERLPLEAVTKRLVKTKLIEETKYIA